MSKNILIFTSFFLALVSNIVLAQYAQDYRLLDISPSTSLPDIKRKCRQLLGQYHPDKLGADLQKYLEIVNACERLAGKAVGGKPTTKPTPEPTKEKKAKQAPSQEQLKRLNEQLIQGVLTNNLDLVKDALNKGAVSYERYPYQGTDPITKGIYNTVSAIELAVSLDEPEILEALLKKRDLYTIMLKDLLFVIAKSARVVNLLVAAGLDVNDRSEYFSPLQSAVREGSPAEVIQALLENGADVDPTDYDRKTPLWTAVLSKGTPEVVDLLIKGRADVNHKDKDGKLLLDAALELQKEAEKNDDVLQQIRLVHIISSLKKAGAQSNANTGWYSRWFGKK